MTKQEAARILTILKAAYPATYRNITDNEAKGTIALWAAEFRIVPFEAVAMALKNLIKTSKFSPTIAEVYKEVKGLYWEASMQLIAINEDYSEAELAEFQRIKDMIEPLVRQDIELEEIASGQHLGLTEGSR